MELLRNLWSPLTHSPRADTTSEELGEKEDVYAFRLLERSGYVRLGWLRDVVFAL